MLVAEVPDGRIAGYADLTDQALEHRRFWIDLRMPPSEDREVASALLEAMEARAGESAVDDASVRVFVPAAHEQLKGIVEGRGYEVFRHSFQMRIVFDRELPSPVWPDGIAVRTFVRGEDDEAVYEAQDEAFEDHFEHARWPYENWREWAFPGSFDPSLWFVAEDGGEIAGVCLCRSEGNAGPAIGWVNVLGVRPRWRRRGVGRSFLLHAFAVLRARGKLGVGLGVDGLNTTGAVSLYENAGMHVAHRFDQYRKPLPT